VKPGMSQSTQLRQELKINPRLYQAMDLLYMPLLDLQQHLKQELLNNPFLDLVEAEEEDEEEQTESEPDAIAESTSCARSNTRNRRNSTMSLRSVGSRPARSMLA